MAIWVRAFCGQRVGQIAPDQLQAGIAARLRLMTSLFPPDEEEDADVVLGRLRVDNLARGPELEIFLLRYQDDQGPHIHVKRCHGKAAAKVVEMCRKELDDRQSPKVERVQRMLARVAETVAFALEPSAAHGMGWPLAIAGAAWFAEIGKGMLHVEERGWLLPVDGGVTVVLRDWLRSP